MLFFILQKLLIPTIVLIWGFVYFIEILDQNPQDQMLIRPVFILLILFYIINSFRDFSRFKKGEKDEKQKGIQYKKTFTFMGLVVIYLIIMPRLGFLVTTILFMLASLFILEAQNNKIAFVGLSVILPIVLYFAFTGWFNVPLPTGIII